MTRLKKILKLPPGLCLVRCDTVKPGQLLTPEQIKDAYVTSGLLGKCLSIKIK